MMSVQSTARVSKTDPAVRGWDRICTVNSNAVVDKRNDVGQYSKRCIKVQAFYEPEQMPLSPPTIPSHVLIINDLPPKETLNLACLIHTSMHLVLDPVFNVRHFTILHMFTNSTLTQLRIIFVNSALMQMQRLKAYLAIDNYCSMFVPYATTTVIQLVDYGFIFRETADNYWTIAFTVGMCAITPPVKSIVYRPLCYNLNDVLLMDIYQFNAIHNSLAGWMKVTGLIQNDTISQFATQCMLPADAAENRCVD